MDNDGVDAAVRISSAGQVLLLDGNELDTPLSALHLNGNVAGNVIIAQGGGRVGIGTSSPSTKLHVDGEVTMTVCNITSDRNAKEQIKPVNACYILEQVSRLTISEWQYKEQPGERHIGPMSQDFHAAFEVGRDDRHITTVDADGVALAAIQGLNRKTEDRSQY